MSNKISIRDLTFGPKGNYKRKVNEASDKMRIKIHEANEKQDVVPSLIGFIEDLEKAQQEFTIELVKKLTDELNKDR